MLNILFLNFVQMVQNAAAAVQSSGNAFLDFSVGSVELALIEAYAKVAQWLQLQIAYVYSRERLATSSGTDVDSFGLDYGFTRLGATQSQGFVTFARFSNTTSTLIPVGSTVVTGDFSQSFTVTADPTNGAWNAGQNGYLVSIGVSSVTVPVISVNAAAAANVLPGTISNISSTTGMDSVSNAASTVGGGDPESDVAYKNRFALWVSSRSQATDAAIQYAISQVQAGLTFVVQENTEAGVFTPGFFTVVVDDGTGSPTTNLLTNVYAAVDAVRALGSRFTVVGPTITTVNVAFSITAAAGFVKSSLISQIAAVITAYVDALPVGATLPLTVIAKLAYDALPGAVANVTGITLNSSTADITVAATGVVKAGTVIIT